MAIGYTIPVLKERSARVFVNGQNLLLLTKYTGWDPEVNSAGQEMYNAGYDNGSYPRSVSWSLGMQLHL